MAPKLRSPLQLQSKVLQNALHLQAVLVCWKGEPSEQEAQPAAAFQRTTRCPLHLDGSALDDPFPRCALHGIDGAALTLTLRATLCPMNLWPCEQALGPSNDFIFQ